MILDVLDFQVILFYFLNPSINKRKKKKDLLRVTVNKTEGRNIFSFIYIHRMGSRALSLEVQDTI